MSERDRFILKLSGYIKDAFLHTDIPQQGDSMIPEDKTFIQMAEYLYETLVNIVLPTNKREKINE